MNQYRIGEHGTPMPDTEPIIRIFDTGANRNSDGGKFDYEAFLSPIVLHEYAAYMHENRFLEDGTMRDGDNWQKGIPMDVYMKSGWRHFHEWWLIHRGYFVYREKRVTDGKKSEHTHPYHKRLDVIPEGWYEVTIRKCICGLLFNAMGYLHEWLKTI
jgi:hypothetical protein